MLPLHLIVQRHARRRQKSMALVAPFSIMQKEYAILKLHTIFENFRDKGRWQFMILRMQFGRAQVRNRLDYFV